MHYVKVYTPDQQYPTIPSSPLGVPHAHKPDDKYGRREEEVYFQNPEALTVPSLLYILGILGSPTPNDKAAAGILTYPLG